MSEIDAALRAEFAPTGTLRIGLNMSNFLLTRIDAATGEPAGVAHDLGQELARRLGLPVSMHPFPNPGAVFDAVAKDQWDVCFLAAEPKRAEAIDFTSAYAEVEASYLLPPGSSLRHAEEIDREGIRIIAPNRCVFQAFRRRKIRCSRRLTPAAGGRSGKM
ncbi:MAG: transporter substrate-binding domain-containing protein [Alphaproteobacteria bacterium]